MRVLLSLSLALPLMAQVPAKTRVDFFERESKALMLDCVKAARSLEPEHSRMLAKYGQVYLAAGDRHMAEEVFALALKSDPKDSKTRLLIGLAWIRNGFKAEAAEAFQKIPVDHKNDLAAAARFLVEAGQITEGEDFMEMAWKLDREDSDNCLAFAKTALSGGHVELAGRWFKRTTEAAPLDWKAWNTISMSYADFIAHRQATR